MGYFGRTFEKDTLEVVKAASKTVAVVETNIPRIAQCASLRTIETQAGHLNAIVVRPEER